MDHDPPSRTIIVRDGSVIIVRPIEPGDRVLLEAAFAELSDESRYRRFLSPMPRLTAAQLEYLTDVDHHDHEALVALEPDGERLIGVARFVRTQPAIAEPAVAVADEWQRRGVGTALLEVLVDRAIEEGITTFSGYVLLDNPAPLSLLGQVGDVSVRSSGGASQVEVLLLNEDATAPAPGALRTLLRALAASTLEPGLGFWQRLLPPARGQVGDERRNVIVAAVAEGDRTLAGELAAASAATLVLVASPHDAERTTRLAAELERAGVTTTAAIVRGELGAAVLRVAAEQQARLIVVHDPGTVSGRLVSASWDFVTHHAPCHVLVDRSR